MGSLTSTQCDNGDDNAITGGNPMVAGLHSARLVGYFLGRWLRQPLVASASSISDCNNVPRFVSLQLQQQSLLSPPRSVDSGSRSERGTGRHVSPYNTHTHTHTVVQSPARAASPSSFSQPPKLMANQRPHTLPPPPPPSTPTPVNSLTPTTETTTVKINYQKQSTSFVLVCF